MDKPISIPYDLYESPKEIIILMPISGVQQESIRMEIKNYALHLSCKRESPIFKEDCVPKKQDCYRGPITVTIQLPPHVYFDKIHSTLSTSNILTIVIPKNIIPEHIPIEIEKAE